MSDNTVILEVKELHKSFDGHEVLKGISTTIKKGDVLALIGPSGCGKSTFLRSLNLLEIPTAGHVLFEGTDLTDPSVDINHVREKIGMVFQQFNLLDEYSVLNNICMPLRLDGRKPDETFLAEVTKMLGIEEKLKKYPYELSGGEQQRVAIARSILAKPHIIFADEPTGNLDKKAGEDTLNLLSSCAARFGQTLIIVTHDLEIAKKADRIIKIEDGKIVSNQL